MTLQLRITKAPDGIAPSQTVHVFDKAGGTLGRGVANTLCLPDPERILSSRHCEFVHSDDRYHVVDWSTNGTFLNSSPEPVGKGTSATLKEGDVIEVGDYCISVEFNAAPKNTPCDNAHSPFSEPVAATPEPAGGDAIAGDSFQSDPFGALSEQSLVGNANALDPLQVLDGMNPSSSSRGVLASAWETSISGESLSNNYRADAELFSELSSRSNGAILSDGMPDSRVSTMALRDPGVEALVWPEPKPESLIPDDWMTDATPAEGFPSQVYPSEPPPAPTIEPRPELSVAAPPEPHVTPRTGAVKQRLTGGSPVGVKDSDSLFEAMGLDVQKLTDEDRRDLLPLMGKMMREMIDGMMQVLRSRASIKNEFRMNVTTIQPVENNPLKFSADVDEALDNIFVRRSQAYKEPLSAVREGFQEVAEHQLAMIAGMRSAFEHMLRDFDHERLESRFDQHGKRSAVSMVRRSRYWCQYQSYFRELSDNIERSFQNMFGDEFVQAYQDQLRRLSSLRPS